LTEKEHGVKKSAIEYEVEVRSDGISSVRTTIQSEEEAVSFSRMSAKLLDALSLGPIIDELKTYCTLVDSHLVLEKAEGIPDDLRLVVTTAVRYPIGLSDEIVQEKLIIKANSRKAYVSTSKYLSYDKIAKFVYINTEGIKWALSELKSKEAKDTLEKKAVEKKNSHD